MVFPSKLIIVMYSGRISLLAGTWGPILSPFWCEIPIIEQLIEAKYIVYEILPNGDRILLDKHNFDKDNGGGVPPGPPIPPVTPPSENDATMANHMKQKIETDAGIHGTLRYMHGHFERFDAPTQTWVVAYAEDKLEAVHTVVDTTVGGLKAGTDLAGLTMDTIVEKLIHTAVPPSVVFSSLPSTLIYEKGSSVATVGLSAQVTKGDDVIQSVKFYKDGVVISTQVVDASAVHTYTYTYTGPITANTEFKVVVVDPDNTVEKVIDYMFLLPKFKGKLAESAPLNDAAISSLTKFIDDLHSISLTVTTANEKVAIAIPSTMSLVSVIDQNNYPVTHLFETTSISHTMIDSSVVSYKLISSIEAMTVDNFTLVFNLV